MIDINDRLATARGFSLLVLFVGTCWAPPISLAIWGLWG